jgi:uncharacterized protein (TIGR03118 family)
MTTHETIHMKTNFRFFSIAAIAVLVFTTIASRADNKKEGFDWTNLVSDIAGVAERVDPNLVNPWGIVPSSNNTIWIANNGTGTSTLYNTDGVPVPVGNPLVVAIPTAAANTEGANPTGIVLNSGSGFVVAQNGHSGPSVFIFVSEDGSISGWNPQVSRGAAILAVDHGAQEAIYKGAALGTTASGPRLFVTNFHAAKVEMYDQNFMEIDTANTFLDPNLPAGYAPFGIRNINGLIYVTYAKQDADAEDDVAGPGFGFVDIFSTTGQFMKRLISQDRLNAPWGLVLASHHFGKFRDALLVGNFGDGRINAYHPHSGAFLGTLSKIDGTPLAFDGLWGLHFIGDELFFTAGIADEEHGLFGVIEAGKRHDHHDDD